MCALKWQKTRFSRWLLRGRWKTFLCHLKSHINHYDDQSVTKSWGTNWSKFFIFESLLKTRKFAKISKNVRHFLNGLFWFTLWKPLQLIWNHCHFSLMCFRPVFEGLAYMHSLGYVHHDIHPANLCFSDESQNNLKIVPLPSEVNLHFILRLILDSLFMNPTPQRKKSLGLWTTSPLKYLRVEM